MLAGVAALIELIYTCSSARRRASTVRFLGLTLDTRPPRRGWLGALAVALVGFAAFEAVRRRFAAVWGAVQGEIEATMTFKEPNAAIPEGGEAAAREANRGEP